MANNWNTTRLSSIDDVLRVLFELQANGWLTRGHSQCYGGLVPKIDRGPLNKLDRSEKLSRERRSIDLFRSTVRFFSDPGERNALVDDFVTLMVLRHYGVPTRLLDWTASPYVATYFAVSDKDDLDGELWTFSHNDYTIEGREQWSKCPQTTTDGSGNPDKFAAGLTAFSLDNPTDCNWIIAAFYPQGFPRQNAQRGAYTLTARFNIDHADALMTLLGDSSRYHRYLIDADLKTSLRATLFENCGIWRGSLFPDTAGAAETTRITIPGFDTV